MRIFKEEVLREEAVSNKKYTKNGYPRYFETVNGEVIAFDFVVDNVDIFAEAMSDDACHGSDLIHDCHVNQYQVMHCSVTGQKIEALETME